MTPEVVDRQTRDVMHHVRRDDLIGSLTGIVDIASPTGGEAPLAQWLVGAMTHGRIRTHFQPLDNTQANAVGVLPGCADGRSILLYAPVDTFTTGRESLDVPWAAPSLRQDMRAEATVHGDLVQGLGAGNPKGHAACVLVAIRALADSGIELAGDVVAAFGAGGMPTFAVPGIAEAGRENTGHGAGATFLLERGFSTDCAVIAKPGWGVHHEEVGLVWVDVLVHGIHTYAGSRHRLPYRNAVAQAGQVAVELESWLETYATAHEVGTMKPQGVVSSVRGGLDYLGASTPAAVRLRLDLRITTEQTPASATREVRRVCDEIAERLGTSIDVVQVAGVPASRTDPDVQVIQATRRAWESVSGVRHAPVLENSGATDANILRNRGVPTARVGMPKVTRGPNGEDVDFTLGMNLVDVVDAHRLVEVLVRTAIDVASTPADTR